MKKVILKISVILFCSIFSLNTVLATSGALKSASIKTCPNGKTYGYHGSNNHWHEAEKSGTRSGWSAIGEPLSGDPCPNSKMSNSGTNNSSTTNRVQNNSTTAKQSTKNTTTKNSTTKQQQKTQQTKVVTKKSNNTGISYLLINGIAFNSISENMNYTVSTSKVDITAKLIDEKASYKIEGIDKKLSIDNLNEVKVIVTAEDGTKKEYTLKIKREKTESKVRISKLVLNDKEIDVSDKKEIKTSVINRTDKLKIEYELTDLYSELLILRDNKEIGKYDSLVVGNNKYKLKIIDGDDNEYVYHLNVVRQESMDAIDYIISLGFLGATGYGIYLLIKKFKK